MADKNCTFVLFGATGDLTRRKLLPALFRLHSEKLLPEKFALVGFALPDKQHPDYVEFARAALAEFLPAADSTAVETFLQLISFVPANFTDAMAYANLASELKRAEMERGTGGNLLIYLATPPALVPDILSLLAEANLLTSSAKAAPWTRIIAEKPYGTDGVTARALTDEFHKCLSENQIYRIDHYLGKDAVQDVMTLRFANTLFEPLWNRNYIEQIQVTVAETLGVGTRGGYFDPMGETRDMVQSHALQVIALLAMEAPNSFSANALRNEKVKVLEAMRPLDPSRAVRGQYEGYRDEERVDPKSNIDTFMAARLSIESWRWQGVPFYIRAGKKLPVTATEVDIQFKPVPLALFRSATRKPEPNRLRLRIQPDAEIELICELKEPGSLNNLAPVELDMLYKDSFKDVRLRDAYERLLLDAIAGDPMLFLREDEIDAAWRVVDPILSYWRSDPADFPNYAQGSWGPDAADELLARDGKKWFATT